LVEIRFKPADVGVVADGAVTEAKLGAGAVTEAKIGALAVSEGKIKADAVTRNKIKDGEVLEAKVVDRAFVKTNKVAGLRRTLSHGYDPVTGELVIVVDDNDNP